MRKEKSGLGFITQGLVEIQINQDSHGEVEGQTQINQDAVLVLNGVSEVVPLKFKRKFSFIIFSKTIPWKHCMLKIKIWMKNTPFIHYFFIFLP